MMYDKYTTNSSGLSLVRLSRLLCADTINLLVFRDTSTNEMYVSVCGYIFFQQCLQNYISFIILQNACT